jgi:hypothetical protein
MSVNIPIINARLAYVNGLQLSWASNTTFTMAAGAASNSTDINDIELPALVTNTITSVGVNGVDIAAAVASSFYSVYIIGDSTKYQPTASLISLSATAPRLPFGYDMYRRVGFILTDGSANIRQFWQYGNNSERTMYYDVGISELAAGAATTFTAIDLATSVPPVKCQVIFDVAFTPDGATEVAEFLPFGSTATAGIVRFGTGVAGAQVGTVMVPSALDAGVPKVLYKVAAGDTLTLLTVGYVDSLS